MQDGWSDHGDDDETLSYPSAPLPPHERLWRHPSELGPRAIQPHHSPSLSRGLATTAGVVGVMAAIGMFQLITSTPGDSTMQAASSISFVQVAATTRPPTTLPEVTTTPTSRLVAPTMTSSPDSTILSVSAPTIAAITTPTLVSDATPSTPKPQPTPATDPPPTVVGPLSTIAVGSTGRTGLVVANGDYAVTSAESLTTDSTMMVVLPNGVSQYAAVVSISDGLAIIALATPMIVSATARVGLLDIAGAVVLDAGSWTETTPLNISEATATIRTESTPPTGCPIRTVDGALVGVAVPLDAHVSRVVTVAQIDELVLAADRVGGWLGINGSTNAQGATVHSLTPGSPAEVAGLLPNDHISAVDGFDVVSVEHLASMIRTLRPGRSVTLTVTRNAEVIGLVVTLGDREARTAAEVDAPLSAGPLQPSGTVSESPSNDDSEEPSEGRPEGNHPSE